MLRGRISAFQDAIVKFFPKISLFFRLRKGLSDAFEEAIYVK
jgi:hypothetical protein